MATSADDAHHAEQSSDEETRLTQIVDNTYRDVEAAHVQVQHAQESKSNKVLNRAGDLYDTVHSKIALAEGAAPVVEQALQSDPLKTIQESFTTFAESLPGVLRALDAVAEIHPFIKVAVGAFRVVVELDVKRRDNDKKITVLFIEMRDMMAVLIELGDVKDTNMPGPDGTTIKARLQGLVKRTADDIKGCANACDTYAKKNVIVKVIKSSSWDEKFKAFLTLFADRRKAFMLALAIHMGKAVDDVRDKLESIEANLKILTTAFTMLVTPEQEQIRDAVESQGGPEAVARDDRALTNLVRLRPSAPGSATVKRTDPSRQERNEGDELRWLKEELFDSADVAIQKNFDTFARKFAVQQERQIKEMQDVVKHENDRLIENLSSGPHDRLKDPMISNIWKDMRWRGHVKARHFVLALRDHYLEQANTKGARGEARADLWAVKYINVNNVSAIAEACDDDASGFITVAEVNTFTSSRPRHWSLLKWLAWWSEGWHLSLLHYAEKIEALFEEMFALLPTIRAENHALAFRYLDGVWDDVSMLIWPLFDVEEDAELSSRFSDYVAAEERRLEDNLKTFRYNIDAQDTLSLITGPGRIEMFLFPLLYLLLRRHLEIFRLCQTKVVIHHSELEDCEDSITCVLDAVDERGYFLERIFRQRNLNPKRQFANFAGGMFNYWYNDEEKWTIKGLMEEDEDEDDVPLKFPANRALPDPNDVLLYPTPSDNSHLTEQDVLTEDDLKATGMVKDVLGRWYGFCEADQAWPAFPMFSFFLHSAGADGFTGNAITVEGEPYVINGRVTVNRSGGDNGGHTALECTWTFGSLDSWSVKGVLTDDKQSIAGHWQDTKDKDVDPHGMMTDALHLTRLAPEILVARPPPWEFEENRIGALWSFLRAYVRTRFRRRSCWRYVKDYLTRSLRYVALLMKEREQDEDWDPTTREELREEDELEELRGSFTYAEAAVCHRLLDMRVRAAESIARFVCDVCGDECSAAHYVCIQCSLKLDYPVDLCDKPECWDAVVDVDETTHLPRHDVIKLHRPTLPYHDLPRLFRLAKETLRRAHGELKKASARSLKLQASAASLAHRARTKAGHRTSEASDGSSADDSDDDDDDDELEGRAPPSDESSADSQADTSHSLGSKRVQWRRKRPAAVMPTCVSCDREVRRPCLVCIECRGPDDVFICHECDAKGVAPEKHVPTHTLVRCKPPSIPDTSGVSGALEQRLRTLVESHAAAQAREIAALNERMSRIERLLEGLTTKPKPARGR